MKKTIFAVAMVGLLAACGGSNGPSVEVISASPDTIDPTSDAANDLTIKVRYKDGNGDLGGGVARVYDCRAEGLVTELAIPAIANADAVQQGVAISGELDLVVKDVGEVEAGAAPAAVCRELGGAPQAFCVVLVDEAGMAGDGACTGPIRIAAP